MLQNLLRNSRHLLRNSRSASLRLLILFGMMNLICINAFAASSPTDMVQTTTNQMIAELQQNETTLKSNPGLVYNIVHRILLPHADLATMSRLVVGRNAWMSASPRDRAAFVQEFTTTLIRTYASALASYTNQTVTVFPIRGGYENQNAVQVDTQVNQPDGPPVPVSYRLALEGGSWKVIDFSVDGVSIVENYRAQFANDLSQGSLANLTNKLAQHNANMGNS
jgi:phospholipid transport system substrate-binding protein